MRSSSAGGQDKGCNVCWQGVVSAYERLGHDATVDLLELVESGHAEQEERVLSIAVERFERRLAEELADLRVALVREIHETRSETIKSAFLFWVTQASAFVGMFVLVYRGIHR
jgi:hypothetical protein